jgi:hypothetical protein
MKKQKLFFLVILLFVVFFFYIRLAFVYPVDYKTYCEAKYHSGYISEAGALKCLNGEVINQNEFNQHCKSPTFFQITKFNGECNF